MSDQITLNFLASSLKLQNFSLTVSTEILASDLIDSLKVQLGIENIKLVHKGRTVIPNASLKDQNLTSGSKIIISQDTPKAYYPPEKKSPEKIQEMPQPVDQSADPVQKAPKTEEITIHESILSNLFMWGQNSYGKLGISFLEDTYSPYPILIENTEFQQVSCGASVTVALSRSGQIYNWGRLLYPKSSNPNYKNQPTPILIKELTDLKFTKVAAGNNHFIALDSRGDIWTWGEGTSGQLGHGVLDNEFYPKKLEALIGFKSIEIAAGAVHSAAITSLKTCLIWGKNTAKQLGTGDTKERLSPSVLLNLKANSVKCGNFHTLWQQESQLFICGNNKDLTLLSENCKIFEAGGPNSFVVNHKGELSIFTEELERIQELVVDIKQISSNGSDLLIVTNAGELIAKGTNRHGELGIGNTVGRAEWALVNLPFKVAAVSCGSSHVAALVRPTSLVAQVLETREGLADCWISCPDGKCKVHSGLLSSHTDPSVLFERTVAGYSSELPMVLTEAVVSWMYCKEFRNELGVEELSALYSFALKKNLGMLGECVKFELDFKTADLQYLMYYPEINTEKAIEEMVQAEMKMKKAREKSEEVKERRDEREERSEEMDFEDEVEDEIEEPDEVTEQVVIDPNERRRKILEALEKRSNPN